MEKLQAMDIFLLQYTCWSPVQMQMFSYTFEINFIL
jgi:hypothetical protein